VFGTGSVGLSAVMAAHASGVGTIVAVDVVRERLALADELGATGTVDAREVDDPGEVIRELTSGQGVPFAIDTTGRPATVHHALSALTPTGTLGLIAPGSATTQASFGLLELILGRTVRGIQQGDSVPRVFIPRLIEMHRSGRLPLERIVTRFPFAEINQAAAAQERGEVVKPVLVMDERP
jgi:aryl-alcohol dehydrogenase